MPPGTFELTTEHLEGPVQVIGVKGELDLDTAPQLGESLKTARSTGGISVLINLSDCEFIDSSGLALIVRCWRDLESKEGNERLVLCCATDQVKRLIAVTEVDRTIAVHDELDEALADLRGKNETTQPA